MTQSVLERFIEQDLRTEVIIHIASACHDYAFGDAAERAFQDDQEDIWPAIGLQDPDTRDLEEIGTVLFHAKKLGFLVQVATPVPTFHRGDGTSWGGSWGHYATKWIYAETFDDALSAGLVWQAEYMARTKEKQLNTEVKDASGKRE